MRKPLTLPTAAEIERAKDETIADGPIALAGIVDANPFLRALIDALAQSREGRSAYRQVKVAFISGLNLGIRLGEARVSGKETVQ